MERTHDIFMSDLHPDDPTINNDEAWDRGLTTSEVISKITRQVFRGESDGDELTIVIRTSEVPD